MKVALAIAKLAVAAKKFYQDEKPNMQSAMMVYNPATSSPNQASIDLAHHVALVATQLRANTNLFTVLHTAISHEFQISVELSLDPATLQRSIGQLGGVEVKMTTYIGAQDANHPPPLPVARKLGVPSCCVDCDVCSTNKRLQSLLSMLHRFPAGQQVQCTGSRTLRGMAEEG